jgi:hypothetical protein
VTASTDADAWQDVETDLPAILNLTFLNGQFFGLALWKGIYRSSDGVHFSAASTDAAQLGAIAYDATHTQTTAVMMDNPDQLDCRTQRCVLFSGALLLVP